MEQITWRDLMVTNDDGDVGETLESLINVAPGNLDNATITDGRISAWPGFFISPPGQSFHWDTLCENVDWTGFEEALVQARKA